MKNLKWIAIAVFVFVAYAAFMQTGSGKKLERLLSLSNVEALAADEELPEVEIVCGETEGKCWDGECIGYAATPLGVYRSWDCDTFTGLQEDVCFNDVPC